MRPKGRTAPLVLALLVAVVAGVVVVQIRSQAEVQRSLAQADTTSLAFQIDDLHRSNEALAAEATELKAQREALRSGGPNVADAQLTAEAGSLQVIEGLAPARGPGVVLTIDAPLSATDLEDAVNNLRLAGAEAISVGGHRVVTGTAITESGGGVSIDGAPVHGPWEFDAIGEPAALEAAAATMTRSLRSDPRVSRSSYAAEPDLVIAAVIRPRPFVYGLPR